MGLKALLGGKKEHTGPEKNAASQKDALTGLPNRYYFKENFGEHGLFNTVRYKSVAVFDIDGFMAAQDRFFTERDFLGVNVTIPYKKNLSKAASSIGKSSYP